MGNLSGWTESIVLVVAFAAVITLAVAGFNNMYDKDYNIPLVDNYTQEFIDYQTQARSQFETSDVDIGGDNGITVANSYSILWQGIRATWTFLSGGWIPNIGVMLNAGEAGMLLMRALQVVWVLSLVFGLLYVLWRVPT